MIAPAKDVLEARVIVTEHSKGDLIPVFEAIEEEVTHSNESEMIVYCEGLKRTDDKYKFSKNFAGPDKHIQEKCVCVIKISSINEEFLSSDLIQDGV